MTHTTPKDAETLLREAIEGLRTLRTLLHAADLKMGLQATNRLIAKLDAYLAAAPSRSPAPAEGGQGETLDALRSMHASAAFINDKYAAIMRRIGALALDWRKEAETIRSPDGKAVLLQCADELAAAPAPARPEDARDADYVGLGPNVPAQAAPIDSRPLQSSGVVSSSSADATNNAQAASAEAPADAVRGAVACMLIDEAGKQEPRFCGSVESADKQIALGTVSPVRTTWRKVPLYAAPADRTGLEVTDDQVKAFSRAVAACYTTTHCPVLSLEAARKGIAAALATRAPDGGRHE